MKALSLDWSSTRIDEIASVKTGPFGSALHEADYALTGTPIVTVEHLGERGIQHTNLPLVGDEDVRRLSAYICRPGDILFSRVGSIDRNSLVSDSEDGWLFSGRLLRVRTDTRRVHPPFLSYVFSTTEFKDSVRAVAVGQTMPSLNTKLLGSLWVSFPDLTQQRTSAEALRDADTLISSIERLIVKKQAIKQGIMQQLLTGKTRLPGFSGVWTTRRIGDFAEVKSGGTPSTAVARYWGGNISWMSSGEIHQKRVRDVQGRITTDGLRESSAQLLPRGTVLMALAGQGKTRGTVAISRIELSTNQSIAGILPSEVHDSDFLYYNLDTRYLELRGESTGDGGRGGLNLTIIKKLEVLAPDVREQRAIARVLTVVDDEIETLKRRLSSMRNIKQGMMQELLTGRTRLLRAEAAA